MPKAKKSSAAEQTNTTTPAATDDRSAAGGTETTIAQEPANEQGDIEILFIKSVPPTFRRCGFRFNREGHDIELAALTKEQIEILVKDPNLVVTQGFATDKNN